MKANQDIRDYMADHGVTQKMLANAMGTSQYTISKHLSKELSQIEKEEWLNTIDAIAQRRDESFAYEEPVDEPSTIEEEENEDVTEDIQEEETEEESNGTKFQIGYRVIIPSKANKVGIVSDIWSSLAKNTVMYSVENASDGYCGMYSEHQIKPEPLPIDFTFESCIDGNVAVATMIATQGDKTWIYARGHAHIIHDGPVGLAQAISYAGRRMFETLDRKQDKAIYFK